MRLSKKKAKKAEEYAAEEERKFMVAEAAGEGENNMRGHQQ